MLRKVISAGIVVAAVCGLLHYGLLLPFIFFYPLFMSFIWMVGSIYFYFHWERGTTLPTERAVMDRYPLISILIPCYNEHANIHETIEAAANQDYPEFEIIAINDGSHDATGPILEALMKQYPMMRVVHLLPNQGKAMALRVGALVARSEYLVCVDGDAMLDRHAASHLVRPLIMNPRVGAVTGNPRVRTRATLLGRVQVGEFSSIIGLIKRAQRIYGQIFTVSGVIAAFRRTALHRCGYWSLDMVTEDIDISWKLQFDHWSIQYEPNALGWILMPETYKGLWRQRLRWAQGGSEVFLKNMFSIWHWEYHRMWAIMLDYFMSLAWSFAFMLTFVLYVVGHFMPLPPALHIDSILPSFWGLMLATTNLLQAAVAIFLESRYEKQFYHRIVWIIWYPMIFWLVTMLSQIAGFLRALVKSRKRRARWTSPDRGYVHET